MNAIETTLYITYENSQEIGFSVKIYNSIKEDSSSLVYTVLEDKQDSKQKDLDLTEKNENDLETEEE